MQPREYTFDDRLAFSQGVSTNSSVETILIENLAGAVSAHPAHESNDRNGTDWWVEMERGTHVSIDCKVREKDYSLVPPPVGGDDLALETYSVVEKSIMGWTRDTKKRSDFILWLWTDTGRWCLISFPMLCQVFKANWREWCKLYKVRQQRTSYANGGGYHSECVFVPRREVWRAIYDHFGGAKAKAA